MRFREIYFYLEKIQQNLSTQMKAYVFMLINIYSILWKVLTQQGEWAPIWEEWQIKQILVSILRN